MNVKTLTFFSALLKTSIRASISLRGAFALESIVMILNNLVFLLMWWIFFRQFNNINGWTLHDMIALTIIGTGSFGLLRICFGGTKYLATMIVQGELDPFMTQPQNLLIHLLGSRSVSRGWGHLMTCAILIALGGFTLSAFPLLLLSMVCGALVFCAINVIAQSLVFWLGDISALSKKYCDSLFIFCMYPTHIYRGFLQIIMYTLLPAGIIGTIPVELLRHFSWSRLAILLSSTLVFCVLAIWVFGRGLKRYESGNQFGARL